mgnify:FL=1
MYIYVYIYICVLVSVYIPSKTLFLIPILLFHIYRFETDVTQYIQKLKDTSIKLSNDSIYKSHIHCNSNIIFTANHPGINSMRKNILGSTSSSIGIN